MKAGNWKSYQEFVDKTNWMDPYEAHADEDAAFEREWESGSLLLF